MQSSNTYILKLDKRQNVRNWWTRCRPGRGLLTIITVLVLLTLVCAFVVRRYMYARANPTTNYVALLNQRLHESAPEGEYA